MTEKHGLSNKRKTVDKVCLKNGMPNIFWPKKKNGQNYIMRSFTICILREICIIGVIK